MRTLLTITRCGLAFATAGIPMARAQTSSLAAPARLTVEYLTDPVGLDTPSPRLSWKLTAARPDARNLRQGAYQVLVASTPERLARDEGDLWDSGRVASEQSLNVVYAGRPLATSRRCHWKVRAWEAADASVSSPWSAPGRWIMGVVRPEDWKAKWIGAHASTRPDCDLAGAQWIWAGDAEGLEKAAAGQRYFRKVFDAPQDVGDGPVLLALTADDRYEVFLNGQSATKTWGHLNDWRWMRFIDVSAFVKSGRNLIAVVVVNDHPGPTGLLAVLKFAGGGAVPTDASWTASSEAPAGWKEGVEGFTHPAWKAVAIAGAPDCRPWGRIERRIETSSPAFEKTFAASKPVREATLHITGLGFYEARLNGAKIGRKVLDPPPTRFDKRVLYSTYDLTGQVKRGENRLNVLVGHGWYDVRSVAVWNFDNAPWRDFPRMLARLELVYEDGSREAVVSDETWRQVASPIGFDCIREGEVIGRAPPGAPDFAKARLAADVVPAPAGRLAAAALPPSVIARELPPAAVREVRPGVWTVDFGQNLAGWIRLNLRGHAAGDIVTIRYGERVAADGAVDLRPIDAHFRYPASFRVLPKGYFQTDRFVCDGSPEQVYEPRFTYNGFQYAEIHGLRERPSADTVRASVVHTDFAGAGSFACSSDLLNRLQECVLWSYRGNFVNGYPTDCPHREKNGWTGDASLASELAMYNFQNTAAYAKWIGDLIDEQRTDGNLPGIVPTGGWGYQWGNGPAWDSALAILPWMLYVYQGDARTLETAYDAMRRYVDYMTSRARDGLVSHGLGDWIPVKSKTPVEVTSSGYYYLDAQIVARAAQVLGKTEDAAKYTALAASIREAYTRQLYKGGGVYSIGSQTAQGCALHQGLVPPAERTAVETRLVDAVRQADGYPDFGILGSKYVFRALSEAGHSDLAFAMASKEDAPSYGAWLKRGATTFWEDWGDGASRNHIMFGDVSAWFDQYLGGIRLAPSVSATAERIEPRAVGFKEFILCPDPVDGLQWVRAEHDSPYGTIRSHWKKDGGVFTLEVEVPVNTSATVYLPAKPDAQNVVAAVPAVPSDRDRMAFKVGSGRYTFTVR